MASSADSGSGTYSRTADSAIACLSASAGSIKEPPPVERAEMLARSAVTETYKCTRCHMFGRCGVSTRGAFRFTLKFSSCRVWMITKRTVLCICNTLLSSNKATGALNGGNRVDTIC